MNMIEPTHIHTPKHKKKKKKILKTNSEEKSLKLRSID